MATLIHNIKTLVNTRPEYHLLKGIDLSHLPVINDAYLIIEGEHIAAFGEMPALSHPIDSFDDRFDAGGRLVLPSWCDSHTHLVFAGSREDEFVDKIRGLSYAEIAARGGGILSSAQKVSAATEEELIKSATERLHEIAATGTGAVEIKSGYGLSVEGELKMLRVIKSLKQTSSLQIRSTFLGAHAIPKEYKENKEGYIELIIQQMLPAIAAEGLADYIDVFCENGFFTPEETVHIGGAGKDYGLLPRLHTNQLTSIGGIEAGLQLKAVSLDHLETVTENDLGQLSNAYARDNWQGLCTLLPTAALFLRMPLQPARSLIDAGCAIALASDYNPGSSPSGNMNFVISMACIGMRMLPEEAINAATINGAYAMGLEKAVGSITVGKTANLIVTDPVPSLNYLPYSFGNNRIHRVMLKGTWM